MALYDIGSESGADCPGMHEQPLSVGRKDQVVINLFSNATVH
jgi:hypothetical protein